MFFVFFAIIKKIVIYLLGICYMKINIIFTSTILVTIFTFTLYTMDTQQTKELLSNSSTAFSDIGETTTLNDDQLKEYIYMQLNKAIHHHELRLSTGPRHGYHDMLTTPDQIEQFLRKINKGKLPINRITFHTVIAHLGPDIIQDRHRIFKLIELYFKEKDILPSSMHIFCEEVKSYYNYIKNMQENHN